MGQEQVDLTDQINIAVVSGNATGNQKEGIMKRSSKLSVILGLMIGLCSGLYPNGFNLNSNGTKALTMGGTFIALADDYNAVLWLGAGIAIKPTDKLTFTADAQYTNWKKMDVIPSEKFAIRAGYYYDPNPSLKYT